MNNEINKILAEKIDSAIQIKKSIKCITSDYPDITIHDAYAIQRIGLQLRKERGEKVIGYKMGFTSKEKQAQLRVKKPIFGTLTNTMLISDGGNVIVQNFIQPKIEPEIGFIVGKTLKGKISFADVLENCSGVCAALDIIDSRYENFKFTLIDVIADNASAGACVFSKAIQCPASLPNLSNLKMTFYENDIVISEGSSRAILDNPVNSVILLSELLSEKEDNVISEGSIILCGAAMPAISLKSGCIFRLEVEQLGSVLINTI